MPYSNSHKSLFAIIPVGAHNRTAVDTVQTLTAPANANVLLLQAEDASIRYTIDGTTNPTSDIGFLLEASDAEIRLDLYYGCSIKVLGVGASVNYQWARASI